MEQSCTVVEAGVDWLTLRARDPIRATALRTWLEDQLQNEVRAGEHSRPWAWYGFAGATAGAVRWGVGDRGVVGIISGPRAHSSFRAATAYAETVTRIDLCATVRCEPPRLDISSRAHDQAVVAYKAKAGTPKPSLWIGSEGGITAYLGDRSSAYFGRIYNKEIESQNVAYTACWRYEVECKAAVAHDVARQALAAPDLVRFVAGYVWGWWHTRSVEPAWESEDHYAEAKSPFKSTGDANSLGWLHTAVQPTVQRLLRRGLVDQVYQALGLTI